MPGKNDTTVYIGRQSMDIYVREALAHLNEGKECYIKARGKAISQAVDLAEVIRNRFMQNVEVRGVAIGRERAAGPDGKEGDVSSIEITLCKRK